MKTRHGLVCIAVCLAWLAPLGTAQANWLKDLAGKTGDYVTDSTLGRFVKPAERNQRDRERIMSVLSYQRAISVRPDGEVIVLDRNKLDKYYRSLQDNGALNKVYGFGPKEDKYQEKSGQFWRNFFDGKDHTRGDTPAVMDPFENASRGLATKMHSQLATPTDDASTSYSDTASTLKVRNIDIMDEELRRGVANGARVYIEALDKLTAGQSSRAVAWAEQAAELSEKDAKTYIEGKIRDEVTNQLQESLKNALGEEKYESLLEGYDKYNTERDKLEAMVNDLSRLPGGERLKEVSERLQELKPENIAETMRKKMIAAEEGAEAEPEEGAEQEAEKDSAEEQDPAEEKEPAAEAKAGSDENADASDRTEQTVREDRKADEVDGQEEPAGTDVATEPGSADDDEGANEQSPDAVAEEPDLKADDGYTRNTKGYVEGKDGSRISIVETRDADGNVIREEHIETDADGREIGKTTYEGESGQGRREDKTDSGKVSDLRGAEAESQVEVTEEMAENGGKTAVGDYSERRDREREAESEDGYTGMDVERELRQARTAGDADRRQAEYETERGGEDARKSNEESTRDVAEADRENSWGKHIGDAIEAGVTKGFESFGEAVGRGAADQVSKEIWKPKKPDKQAVAPSGDASGEQQVAAAGVSSDGGGAPEASAPAQPSPDGGGGDEAVAEDGDAEPQGEAETQASGSSGKKQDTSKPSSSGPPCALCGHSPLDKVPSSDAGTAYYLKCSKCGWKIGVSSSVPPAIGQDSKSGSSSSGTQAGTARKCPTCGSGMLYDPGLKRYTCAQCASKATTATPKPEPKKACCPNCDSPNIKFSHDHHLYGNVYKCNACGASFRSVYIKYK